MHRNTSRLDNNGQIIIFVYHSYSLNTSALAAVFPSLAFLFVGGLRRDDFDGVPSFNSALAGIPVSVINQDLAFTDELTGFGHAAKVPKGVHGLGEGEGVEHGGGDEECTEVLGVVRAGDNVGGGRGGGCGFFLLLLLLLLLFVEGGGVQAVEGEGGGKRGGGRGG